MACQNALRSSLLDAIASQDARRLDLAIEPLLEAENPQDYLDILNQLLLIPYHTRHQEVAWSLQQIGSPDTVPFVRQVLESHFDYLEYTCSESGVIAKWFSHLLWKIGTPEAIALIEEYAQSSDEGIQGEMQYRLRRISQRKSR